MKEGRKDRSNERRNKGRKKGRKEGKKGRKEGRRDRSELAVIIFPFLTTGSSSWCFILFNLPWRYMVLVFGVSEGEANVFIGGGGAPTWGGVWAG